MPTFGELKADIADDLDDTTGEYADQITRAIYAAIDYAQTTPYYFTDGLGSRRLPTLNSDAQVNGWTADAYYLIKARAKYILYKNTIKDPDGAAEALNDYEDQRTNLLAETGRRRSTGVVRATRF